MPIINLEGVQVESGERVLAVITLPNFEKGHNLVMATQKGIIKKTPVEQFERVRSTGIRAINVAEDDALAWVAVSSRQRRHRARHAPWATSRASTSARCAPWAATLRASSASGSPGRATRWWAWRSSRTRGDILVLTETGYGKRVPLPSS